MRNQTKISVNKMKGVCSLDPNPSFGRNSHMLQVTLGLHPASARNTNNIKATRNVRKLHQREATQEMDRIKLATQETDRIKLTAKDV
ncbi:hypothetical protein PoB_005818700 [Plakobranchus ocellatus]|uniref:Uncharacterized protein n=1 Tax=Plakobranchus ocellatus TaxID=259542 RepID=A0AAV4CJW1_9GAST|nr:hypothetical protein PoB_005818700 [Plakobranchus ocellatus]